MKKEEVTTNETKFVNVEQLDTWDIYKPSENSKSEDSEDKETKPVRFGIDSYIGSKISLWYGNIVELSVDAIVNSTDENMTSTIGTSGIILEKGGEGLLEEIKKCEICRTGEVRMTKGHNLPSKSVIHTVGPRYHEKYRTAAENALHNCYRNALVLLKENKLRTIAFTVIHSERKGYPPEIGAHIVIRTVRRFLENWGDDIDRIVFVMSGDNELRLYSRVLPLYFPRNEEDINVAKAELPRDIGNEFGETVIEERRIRINSEFGNTSVVTYESVEDKPLGVFTEMHNNPDDSRKKKKEKRQ